MVQQMAERMKKTSFRSNARRLPSRIMGKLPLRRFVKKTSRKISSKLYLDIHNDIHRCSAFISGAGRSGTTWLGEIIASQIPCRIIFEPFYAQVLKDFGVNPLRYMHPSAQNDAWLSYCRK